MIKKMLLLSMMAIMMLSFAGCGQSDSEDVELTEVEQSGSVDVELTEVGDETIKVIKIVREATGLGLKEAKNLVDGAPSIVLEDTSPEQAEELKASLEEAGATVTIK